MEEQSIISNDQLSSVQLQSSKELAKLREELSKEKERSSILSQQVCAGEESGKGRNERTKIGKEKTNLIGRKENEKECKKSGTD